MDQEDDRHVVDIQLGCTGAGAGAVEPTSCCAVCTEPLAGVTVGSYGHSVVCSRCRVRLRFVQGDRCPSVVVAKEAEGTRGGGGDPVVPALPPPPPTPKEGKVGEYWYHGDTAAYFHEEQQNEEASDASKKTNPRYHLWFWFVLLYGGSICVGPVIGSSFAGAAKGGKAMKVLGYVLGMCIPLWVASCLWCPFAWCDDELEEWSSS